jgi:hypothetical protein
MIGTLCSGCIRGISGLHCKAFSMGFALSVVTRKWLWSRSMASSHSTFALTFGVTTFFVLCI